MNKTFVAAALAACTLGLTAPSAKAAAVVGDCEFAGVQNGNAYTGVLAGFAVDAEPGSTVTLQCEIRVNGGTADGGTGSGINVAVVAKPAEFTAEPGDRVEVCTSAIGSGAFFDCHEPLAIPLPGGGSAVCEVLRVLQTVIADIPGVLEIRSDGDLYVAGLKVVECAG